MNPPSLKMWLVEPLNKEVRDALERLSRADDAQHIRVMPDVHLAQQVCVGTVLATSHLIYPGAIGADIGCGMAAVAFQADAGLLDIERNAAQVMGGLYQMVPSNRHRIAKPLSDDLCRTALTNERLERFRHRDGRVQFGTLGRGNHFVEFQRDPDDRLWLMVHCGSRAIGQAIHDLHVKQATQVAGGLCWLDADSDEGRAYMADMQWAMAYAAANRRAIIGAAATLLNDSFGVEADLATYLDCSHNQVRRERHFGQDLWVHRKGAISADEGEGGIIPGSMGTMSFHVEGRGYRDSLRSSSHGAGRRMSRTEARQRISRKELERQLQSVWYDHRIAGSLRDEAPDAYRDVEAVLRAQSELTRIVRKLKPILCYKGV